MRRKRSKPIKFNKLFSIFKHLRAASLFKRAMLLVVLATLLFGTNYFNNQIIQKTLQNILIPTQAKGLPVRLKIPKIKVDAVVEHVGVTAENAMDVPSNSANAAWFKLGPKPGEKGSAVMDGHVDGIDGGKGVFGDLRLLTEGDKIYVQNDQGKSVVFIVQNSRIYDEGTKVPDVFSRNDGAYLNLITCDGVWDGTKNTYTQRLVIFAAAAK